jgi:hypothetical protein
MPNNIAIMQPYFLPYLGYWQMLNSVGKFILFDDVNFIKKGWINRNRILLNGKPHYLGIPLQKASQNLKINQLLISEDIKWREKALQTIRHAYSKAPYFLHVYPLVEQIFAISTIQLSDFLRYSIVIIKDYLDIQTLLVGSSSCYANQQLDGKSRIIDICHQEHTNQYINAPGGRELYSAKDFKQSGLTLKFISPNLPEYPQFGGEFIKGLSILDVLMFNSKETVTNFLDSYSLTDA